jgi:hypothetical protein
VACHQEAAMDAEDDRVEAWRKILWQYDGRFDVDTFNCFIPNFVLGACCGHLTTANIHLFEDVEVLEDSLVWQLISHVDGYVWYSYNSGFKDKVVGAIEHRECLSRLWKGWVFTAMGGGGYFPVFIEKESTRVGTFPSKSDLLIN